MRIIAYTYEAGIHCPACAIARFGGEPGHTWVLEDAVDREGNPVHPVFAIDEMDEDEACATCGEVIE